MKNNDAHFWISIFMLWLGILAWDDTWAQKPGMHEIIIALVLLSLGGLLMAAGKNNTNEDADHDD